MFGIVPVDQSSDVSSLFGTADAAYAAWHGDLKAVSSSKGQLASAESMCISRSCSQAEC